MTAGVHLRARRTAIHLRSQADLWNGLGLDRPSTDDDPSGRLPEGVDTPAVDRHRLLRDVAIVANFADAAHAQGPLTVSSATAAMAVARIATKDPLQSLMKRALILARATAPIVKHGL